MYTVYYLHEGVGAACNTDYWFLQVYSCSSLVIEWQHQTCGKVTFAVVILRYPMEGILKP